MWRRNLRRCASLRPMLRIIGVGQLLILFWVLTVTRLASRGGFLPLVALVTLVAQLGSGNPATRLPCAKHPASESWRIVDEPNGPLERESSRLETGHSGEAVEGPDVAELCRQRVEQVSALARRLGVTIRLGLGLGIGFEIRFAGARRP